ncbi:MAG: metal ABC transporter permease [Phycisphaeraceae bacterium]|nr:metal ABC transporter permease [Phycisphaeraceae bacterium]
MILAAAFGLTGDDLWVMLTAALCSVACGVIGCFLVLRRLSLLGDAISHAILPGLAVAFILTNSRNVPAMLAGALVVGVATAVLSSALHRWGRVGEDSAMGVVFTTLFAVGVVLITWKAGSVDLDPGCVLYGIIETVATDPHRIAGMPSMTFWLAAVAAFNIALVAVFYKELKVVSFDQYLAATMGISVPLIHYGLMTMVAATSVVSFEAVGSILVVAMLVAPGATAHLLTDRLGRMLVLAAVLGTTAAILGYLLALWTNSSVSGMVSVVAGCQFLLAALAAPRHGVVSKLVHGARLSLRIAREDILGDLYRAHESGGAGPATAHAVSKSAGGGVIARLALASLRRERLVGVDPAGTLSLTDRGAASAAQVVRSHRLWESFLAGELGYPEDHVHEPSHRVEHFIGPSLDARLDRQIGASTDPHGRPIPPAGGPHKDR